MMLSLMTGIIQHTMAALNIDILSNTLRVGAPLPPPLHRRRCCPRALSPTSARARRRRPPARAAHSPAHPPPAHSPARLPVRPRDSQVSRLYGLHIGRAAEAAVARAPRAPRAPRLPPLSRRRPLRGAPAAEGKGEGVAGQWLVGVTGGRQTRRNATRSCHRTQRRRRRTRQSIEGTPKDMRISRSV